MYLNFQKLLHHEKTGKKQKQNNTIIKAKVYGVELNSIQNFAGSTSKLPKNSFLKCNKEDCPFIDNSKDQSYTNTDFMTFS